MHLNLGRVASAVMSACCSGQPKVGGKSGTGLLVGMKGEPLHVQMKGEDMYLEHEGQLPCVTLTAASNRLNDHRCIGRYPTPLCSVLPKTAAQRTELDFFKFMILGPVSSMSTYFACGRLYLIPGTTQDVPSDDPYDICA